MSKKPLMRNGRQDFRVPCVIKQSRCSGNAGVNLVCIPDATTIFISFFREERDFVFKSFHVIIRLLANVNYVHAAARNIKKSTSIG